MDYYSSNKRKIVFKRIFLSVFVAVLMIGSFSAGTYLAGEQDLVKELAKKEAVYLGKILGKYSQPTEDILARDVDFDLYWEVWDALKREYVDRGEINEKEMFYGSLRGMVSSLGDPYTVFMDPKIAQEFEDDLAGTFEGIGAEIGIRNDILTIVAPLADMPAAGAGLLAGDKVYAINGESTSGITIDEAVRRIRGPKGTEVVLTISRNGIESVQDITIKRATIIVKSVRTERRDDGIFVVTITNFNDDTITLFNAAVRDIIKADPRGIILDLRNNPGGYLDTAIEVASEWVEEGVVVTEQFSEEEKNEFLARGRARLKDYKTVVLINQGSASASEIVAGALQDYKKATAVGMQTFGKGTVQTLEEFRDGSSIKVTVAKWLTPLGSYINDEGITPDVEVDMTVEDYKEMMDPQMDKAVEMLKGELGIKNQE